MKTSLTILTVLLLAPLAALHAADPPQPATQVTQELISNPFVISDVRTENGDSQHQGTRRISPAGI